MNEFRADLHCHSTCSDGTLTPEKLIQHAIDIGLRGLSITDHDTTEAYKTAIETAKQAGLELVSGIEFSSSHQKISVHILGYSFDPFHPAILNLCSKHDLRRQERNQQILERLSKLGIPLQHDEIEIPSEKHQTIGRPHIALAMVKRGYVESVQEAFKKYLGEGRLAYVSGSAFTIEETLQTIHEAHGFAVIAHPHLIEKSSLIQQLSEMNFDGIECYYGTFHLEQEERWIKMAKRKNWLITGGSDFHGEIKPTIPLGCSWVNQETFNILQTRFSQNFPS
jgi:3',5'-nucleoside bisphosphate phosphatase